MGLMIAFPSIRAIVLIAVPSLVTSKLRSILLLFILSWSFQVEWMNSLPSFLKLRKICYLLANVQLNEWFRTECHCTGQISVRYGCLLFRSLRDAIRGHVWIHWIPFRFSEETRQYVNNALKNDDILWCHEICAAEKYLTSGFEAYGDRNLREIKPKENDIVCDFWVAWNERNCSDPCNEHNKKFGVTSRIGWMCTRLGSNSRQSGYRGDKPTVKQGTINFCLPRSNQM